MSKNTILHQIALEKRRVKWAGARLTLRYFFVALFMIIFFTAVIGFFAWAILSIFNAMGI